MNIERMYSVVRGAHVSEKAAILSDVNNQYTFKVSIDATKPEIKTAVACFHVENGYLAAFG